MKVAWIRFLALACVLLMLAGVAAADTLELKDGRIVQGKFMGGTQGTIRFMVNNEVKVYKVADIVALTFTETETASTAPAQQAAPAPAPTYARSTAQTSNVTVPAGTQLVVRMIDGVDSETNRIGDTFRASLDEDLVVDGTVVAPRGSDIRGRLVEAKEAGRLAGHSELRLELTDMVVDGQSYPISTGEYEVAGKGRGGDTAKKAAIGAAVGAVVGAVAGGGKGAAIGAGVGAGAGTAVQIFTRGEQVKVPSETMLEFTLQQSVTVRVAP